MSSDGTYKITVVWSILLVSAGVGQAIDSVGILSDVGCGTTDLPSPGKIVNSYEPLNVTRLWGTVATCSFTMQAETDDQLLRFVFRSFSASPGDCSLTFVKLYDGNSNAGTELANVCQESAMETEYVSTGKYMLLVVSLLGNSTFVNFTADYTAFKEETCADEETQFQCSNGRCISRSLRCDDVDNCGDSSDGSQGPPANCSDDEETTAGSDLTAVYAACGLVGALLLAYLSYWCFWKPGWAQWRFGICRYLKSCTRKKPEGSNQTSDSSKVSPKDANRKGKGGTTSTDKSRPFGLTREAHLTTGAPIGSGAASFDTLRTAFSRESGISGLYGGSAGEPSAWRGPSGAAPGGEPGRARGSLDTGVDVDMEGESGPGVPEDEGYLLYLNADCGHARESR
ncbi:uncharacterized protein LOC118418645 [Branchiostoma floridae]|uniref:Uncharacterized protein LOC118418645 n=1 Tax=Branchiostoma floridae TaxID=7739 RepID=A0A9J7LD06_BRAFL|nr:uncharacterized protein LOC118418645 [Branchiostoma floridae]